MATPDTEADLHALRNLIAEAETILSTIELPQGRALRALELLRAALTLSDHLLTVRPAVALGAKGGAKMAKRGSEYFSQLAAKRKTRAGGRPRKDSQPLSH